MFLNNPITMQAYASHVSKATYALNIRIPDGTSYAWYYPLYALVGIPL